MKNDNAFVLVGKKTYRLFRRGDDESPFWTKLQIQGVRTAFSLKTADLETAKVRAAEAITAALAGSYSAIAAQTTPNQKHNATTIGEIIASLNASKIPSAPRYTQALSALISKAKGLPASKITTQPAKILNAQLINAAQAGATPEDHASLNSLLLNAKAVFSKSALTHFETTGLALPDLTSFLQAPLLPEDEFRYSDQPVTAKQLKILATLEPPPHLRTLHTMVSLMGFTTHEATTATPKDFAPGGKFFSRSPLPPEISLPKKGPIVPTPSRAKRFDLAAEYKAFLAPYKLTPAHLRFHAAHCWLNRCNSLDAAGDFLGVSLTWAKFHLAALPRHPLPLTWEEFSAGE